MKKIGIVFIALIILPIIARADNSKNLLSTIEKKIRISLPAIESELYFEYPEYTESLIVKYKTRKFMVHYPTKLGKFSSDADETDGPSYEGFMLQINLQEKGTINQASVPQLLKRPYWKTFLNVTSIQDTDKQVYWGLSFGSRTDQKLLEDVKRIINGLDVSNL